MVVHVLKVLHSYDVEEIPSFVMQLHEYRFRPIWNSPQNHGCHQQRTSLRKLLFAMIKRISL